MSGRSRRHAIGQPVRRDDGSSVAIQASVSSFSGPLPPPEALAAFDAIVPGAAERILVMAEKQQTHRHQLESQVVSSNSFAQRLGPILGFVLAALIVLGGFWLIEQGKSIVGMAAILSATASLVAVFVIGKQKQREELADKQAALQSSRQ